MVAIYFGALVLMRHQIDNFTGGYRHYCRVPCPLRIEASVPSSIGVINSLTHWHYAVRW